METTTTTAAIAVKIESRIDFAAEPLDENIPKATPVFLTYVMLKKPSITETESYNVNRDWISDFVQRSRESVKRTNSR